MPISFRCPACKKRVSVSRKYAGRQGSCPGCKTRVSVPSIEMASQVSSDSDAAPTVQSPRPNSEDWNREYLRILAARGLLPQDRIAWVITMLEQTETENPNVLSMLMHTDQLTSEEARAVHAEAAQSLTSPSPQGASPSQLESVEPDEPDEPDAEDMEDPEEVRPNPARRTSSRRGRRPHAKEQSSKRSHKKKPKASKRGTSARRAGSKTQECPACGEPVSAKARTCRHCREPLAVKGSSPARIAIIAAVASIGALVLIAGGIAVNNLGRAKKQRQLCANQLRQLGLGAIQYADDKRFYPHVRGLLELDGDINTSDTPRNMRALMWYGYVFEPEGLICPASNDRARPVEGPARESLRNWFWSGEYSQASLTRSPYQNGANPTLSETTELSYGWTRKGMNTLVRSSALLAADRAIREGGTTSLAGNHEDGWNVLKADATVAWVPVVGGVTPDPGTWLADTMAGGGYLSVK